MSNLEPIFVQLIETPPEATASALAALPLKVADSIRTLFSDLHALRRDAALFDTSPSQRTRVLQLVLAIAAQSSGLPRAIERILATMIFDSRRLPQGAFRGGGNTGHVILTSPQGEIDLQMGQTPLQGGDLPVRVVGRFQGSGSPVEVRAKGVTTGRERSAPIDEDGFFEIPLDAEPHVFTFPLGDVEVVTPEIACEVPG